MIQRFPTVRMRTRLDNGETLAKVFENSTCAFTGNSYGCMNTAENEFSPVEKK